MLHAKIDDKRNFFRVRDEVNLSYFMIEEEQIKKAPQSSTNLLDSCSLSSALALISQESTVIYRKLEKLHTDFADYLRLLEMKIDLIGQAVVEIRKNDVTSNKTRHANISLSGIGFECDEPLDAGQYLEVKMLLVHSTIIIVTFVKVIHCSTNPDSLSTYAYIIGAEYVGLKEAESDVLSQHIAKKQLQLIREQKEKRNESA
jgi:hypothetical protein